MSHSNVADSEAIREERMRSIQDGEPLNTDQVTIQETGGSLLAVLTAYARDTHHLRKGQTIDVETHSDKIVIRPPGEVNSSDD